MNLGNIFQALTQGVNQSDSTQAKEAQLSAGERNYRALSMNKNIAAGQTIQGEVIAKEGNTVQIALEGDTVLTAKLERDLNIMPGQSMSFEVKTNNGSFLSLSPLYANVANEATIFKALSAAGLASTADNIRMVSDMMQEGMAIDKESIAYMNRQFVDFPDAAPETLMQMVRLGIPVSEENIEQFELYKNYEHQLLRSAQDIMEEIPQTFAELTAEGKDAEAAAFYGQIIKALIGGQEAGVGEEGTAVLNKAAAESAGQSGADALTDIVNEAAQSAEDENTAAAPDAVLTAARGSADEAAGQSGERVLEMPDKQIQAENANQAEGAKASANTQEAVKAQEFVSPRQWREIGDMMQKLGAEPDIVRQTAEGKLSYKETLSQINELISANTNANVFQSENVFNNEHSHTLLKELLGSDAFRGLIQGEMTKEWLLQPQEVAYKEKVEQLYERIREQSAKISEAFQMVGKGDSAGAKSVSNLQNNVDFMNQLNNIFTYIQLPLKMAGNQAHGDLYVYTNKKSLARKDGNVSALLHLDMEHLGPVDVYVTMNTAQNKVNTDFALKDEESLNLIAENIHILDERLNARGYSMKANFKLKDEDEADETNVMEEIIKQSKNISVLSHTSFDMRA